MQTNNKLREALDKIGSISAFVAENCGNSDTAKYMNDIISIVQGIVVEPARNCDVGTAKEQDKRFTEFCDKFDGCVYCPFRYKKDIGCAFLWSQEPYKEGDTE